MTLYSHHNAQPAALPHAITLSSGAMRTSQTPFTPAEIADAGYVEAPPQPAYNAQTHSLGWDGSDWTVDELPPVVPTYPPLSGRQLLIALRTIGITADMIDAQIIDLAAQQIAAAQDIEDEEVRQTAIDQIEYESDVALIEWQKASQYERDHALLNDVAAAFDLPQEQVDTLWLWAADL